MMAASPGLGRFLLLAWTRVIQWHQNPKIMPPLIIKVRCEALLVTLLIPIDFFLFFPLWRGRTVPWPRVAPFPLMTYSWFRDYFHCLHSFPLL